MADKLRNSIQKLHAPAILRNCPKTKSLDRCGYPTLRLRTPAEEGVQQWSCGPSRVRGGRDPFAWRRHGSPVPARATSRVTTEVTDRRLRIAQLRNARMIPAVIGASGGDEDAACACRPRALLSLSGQRRSLKDSGTASCRLGSCPTGARCGTLSCSHKEASMPAEKKRSLNLRHLNFRTSCPPCSSLSAEAIRFDVKSEPHCWQPRPRPSDSLCAR